MPSRSVFPDRQSEVAFAVARMRSEAVFEQRILECVPEGLTIKTRSGKFAEIGPNSPHYDTVLEQFKEDISGQKSEAILNFLYMQEFVYRKNPELFVAVYKDKFTGEKEKKLNQVLSYWPAIDQTTMSILLGISETTVGYRLDDLTRIGLIERKDLGRPYPIHTFLLPLGVEMMENILRDAFEHLAPSMRENDIRRMPPDSSPGENPTDQP